MNIHVLRQVALLSKTFSTDLARELLVRAVNLPVSAAQTRTLEPLETDLTLKRVSTRVSSHPLGGGRDLVISAKHQLLIQLGFGIMIAENF